MLGYELALRERGHTGNTAAILSCVAAERGKGSSPRKAARDIADRWWAQPDEPQPDTMSIRNAILVIRAKWCPGSLIARLYALTTLKELQLWLQQSQVKEEKPGVRTARKLTPRRSPNGHGRWTPPPRSEGEAIPLPRGVDKITPQMEHLNRIAIKDQEGKYKPVTVGTDGGFVRKTREGTAASTPLCDCPKLSQAACDPTIETSSPLPYPCDSSTEAERFGLIQADITFPQPIPLRVKCDAKSAIALNNKSIAIAKNPRKQTVRRQITRRFQSAQTAAENQIRRRIKHGHPIPVVTWIKGHAIDDPDNQVSSDKLPDHMVNTRADALCEHARGKTVPEAYYLLGQPRHYLYSTVDGKPIMHGPRHIIKAAQPQEILTNLKRHRRQGQLLRGNTSVPMVSAAAKFLGRAKEYREQDNMHTRSLTQQLPTVHEMARRGDYSAHWMTENEAKCTVCEPPHLLNAPSLVTCEGCVRVWEEARNKINNSIEREREKHKKKSAEGGESGDTIAIPDRFPELKKGKSVLTFLDPSHPRPYDLHGVHPPGEPVMQPRELPCPEIEHNGAAKRGEEPSESDIEHAYEQLNLTNPIRTCLGAPPKQLPSLLNTLNTSPKATHAIWARLIAPHLMTAVSECLTIQAKACSPTECTIGGCARCEEGEVKEPKRKRRKLSAGLYSARE